MKKRLLFLFIIIANLHSFASHVAGGNISYRMLAKDLYEIKLVIFRDCSGSTVLNSEILNISNNCGIDENITLTMDTLQTRDISMVCDLLSDSTNCKLGGTREGYSQYVYTGTYKLNSLCALWTLKWSTCCRNTSNNINLSNSQYITLKSTINNLNFNGNNSVRFIDAYPIPLVCAGQNTLLNMGGTDADGDSLYYEFVSALGLNGDTLPYTSGHSGTNPIPGISLNNQTGKISFNLPFAFNYVITMKVSEFDKSNGLLKGYVYRDVLIAGKNCFNTPPNSNAGSINNFTGSGTAQQIDAFTLTMCQFDTINFSVSFNDANTSDSLSIYDNILAQLPGAQYNITGKNPLTLNINWIAPSGTADNTINLFITVKDNFCPYQTIQNYVYKILIKPGANAGKDLQICSGDTAYLKGSGGASYTWSLLQGDPLITGQNIECINCAEPWVVPTQNSIYILQTNVPANGCFYLDTVRINVAPNFSATTTPVTPTVCAGDSLSLNISVSPNNSIYTYNWVPNLRLNNAAIANPKFYSTLADTFSYSIIVDNGLGCKKIYNTSVINKALPAATISPTTSTSICRGSNVSLTATSGLTAYSWSPSTGLSNTNTNSVVANPTSTTTYTLNVTGSNGCSKKLTKVVSVLSLPAINVNPVSANICSDSTLRLIATGGVSYTWTPNLAINTIFNDTVLVSPDINISYTVVGYNSSGCANYKIVPVAVTPSPLVSLTVDSNLNCFSNSKTLIASSAPEYSWYHNGNLISNNDSVKIEVKPNNSLYTLITSSTNNQCIKHYQINVPFVETLINDTIIQACAGDEIVLNVSDSLEILNWKPHYNIFDTVSNTTTIHPDTSTLYLANVKNDAGCNYFLKYSVVIDSLSECDLVIYNAITFNGDGMNDSWIVDRINGKESKVIIYNAWGNTIWETTNYHNKTNFWDGKNTNGDRVPDGTYFYMIKVKDKSYNGQLELISKQ